MKNIDYTGTGSKLVITIDMSKRLGESKSGKSEVVATSEGNQKIDGTDVVIGLNAYVKK